MNSLDLMSMRLKYHGGKRDVDRIDWQKNKDLEKELMYSDKSEYVQVGDERFQVLIDGSKYSFNTFDEKEIQTIKKNNLKIGDILFWFRTKSYWIVLEQDLEETAIFKGAARKCNYLDIEYNGINLKGAFFGVKNSELSQVTIDNMVIDTLSDYAQLVLPAGGVAQNIKRYDKLKIGKRYWEVQSINDIMYESIISIYLKETYESLTEETPNETIEIDGVYIDGEKEISPYVEYTYKIIGNFEGDWAISENPYIKILNKNETEITLEWNHSKKGSFTLSYGTLVQEIKVKSLF